MTGAFPADSARVAAAMYSASLLSVVPLALAAGAALALRRAEAAKRVWVWRTAALMLLLVLAGRAAPSLWTAWILPSVAAAPLVAMGRAQMGTAGAGAAGPANILLVIVAFVYGCGAVLAALPLLSELIRLRRLRQRAALVGPDGDCLSRAVWLAASRVHLRRRPRVYVSNEIAIPVTWGWINPVILMPETALRWCDTDLELALAHEFAHARNSDWLFGMIAHFTCTLFWFNPGTWWLSRRLASDRELACDEAVLASGADRFDYANLLMRVADALGPGGTAAAPERASALVSRAGLRARLSAVLTPRPAPRASDRQLFSAFCLAVVVLAAPVSTLRLAPTRSVLDSLMRDRRWETRAFAVAGLAQRSDSLAVARAAAERDPDPQVRAAARRAVAAALSR